MISTQTVRGMVPVFGVVDVARSTVGYRDVLGFSFETFGNPADPTFAQFCRDGVEFMLRKDDAPRSMDGRRGWMPTSAPEVGPIRQTDYGCQEFLISDPDGHVIAIGECT